MQSGEFKNLTSDELRSYMQNHHEDDYQLIDVRQPKEYSQGHIAGARLLPLGELSARLSELPGDRDIVFYWRSGKRSQAAALFAGNRPPSDKVIYNLSGGILKWNGFTLPNFPKMRVFSLRGEPSEIFYQAMDLERGAYHFYTEVLARHREEDFARFIDLLARAEEGHARLIYAFYKEEKPDAAPFEELYPELPGELLEGGQSIEGVKNVLDNLTDEPCLDIVELAMSIEYAAYDLYRNMADYFKQERLKKAFLAIAQAEKEHMRIAGEALACCRS